MGNISLLGLQTSKAGELEQLQLILASDIGTLITVGIGPIVLASIILQLLVGGGLFNIDLSNPAEKARFTALQKLFAIVLSFFEAGVYVFSGFLTPAPGMEIFVILQIGLGAIILLYLDEVVSKYGIGSGIGLFIAGGVAGAVFWRIFNPLTLTGALDPLNGAGLIFTFFREAGSGLLPAIIMYLLPIIFSIIVFLVVVFAEGIHVNIPITMGKKGTGGRFPIKFLYVSNIPVILAAALFANIRLWATLGQNIPYIGPVLMKLSTVVIPPYSLTEQLFLQAGYTPIGQIFAEMGQSIMTFSFIGLGGMILHGIIYIILLVLVCIVFGKFWVEMAGQGASSVSNQLQKAGMSIPGFRRDPRIMQKVLERYIPPITILGSIFVALLAGFADLTGALGSGTGILLTVGIVYRLYEELAKYQLMEMHPMLSKFLGGD
jgi:preprotein translocase subunit SecY